MTNDPYHCPDCDRQITERSDHAGVCADPTHDTHCDCGARPDHEYQSRVEG